MVYGKNKRKSTRTFVKVKKFNKQNSGNAMLLSTNYNNYIPSNVSFKTTEVKSVDFKDDSAYALVSAGASLFTISSVDMTNGALSFFHPVTGVGNYNRVGNKCVIKSIRVNLDMFYRNTDDSAACLGNVYLIYDAYPNKTTPIFSDIFHMVSQSGVVGTINSSFPNLDNQGRFKILKTMPFQLDKQHPQKRIKCFKKTNLLYEAFVGASDGSQTDIMKGALYLCVQPDAFVQPGDADKKTIMENLSIRVRFTDQ